MARSDRCATHQGLAGRPSVVTPEAVERIAALLQVGNAIGTALAAAGVSRRTYQRWLWRRDAAGGEFRERVEQAQAEAEARDVVLIAQAATSDWRAAAWMLEREYPDRWGRHGRARRALRSWPDD